MTGCRGGEVTDEKRGKKTQRGKIAWLRLGEKKRSRRP